MKSLKARRDLLACNMFGREYDYCNPDERVLVLKEMRESTGKAVLAQDEVLSEKNLQGAWVCSAIIGGVRLHRTYMFYSEHYAVTDFRRNPPGIN
jgi:hypothetical protein